MRRRELPGGIPPPTKGELKRQAQAVQDLLAPWQQAISVFGGGEVRKCG